MDDLLKKVQTLSPAKRRLLEKRLATAGANVPQWNNIPQRSQADQAPLSFAQERLWNSQRMDPDSSIYHMVTALHVTGPLNSVALKQSFRAITERHESLRTTFSIVQGTARQLIHAEPRLDWRERDLSPLPSAERLEQARKGVRNAANEPFDLCQGPLCRTVLIRIAEREFVFAFVVHHLVFDGTSFGILYRELASLYRGDAPEGAAPSLQYADYAEWQRARLAGAALEPQSAYWRKKLAHLSPLTLPTDFPRPQRTTYAGGHVSLSLTQTSIASLTQLANEAGCTPFAVLLAGFAALLARYSQQTDISLLVHCDNRDRPEIESVIGNFVNTLIIRVQVPGTLSFKDLLSRVHRTVMEAHTHKDFPFARLLDHLSRLASPNSARPIQAYFNMRNPENGSLKLNGLDVEPFSYTDQRSTKLDLTLETQIEDGHLSGAAIYNADIFAEDTVRGLLRHYDRLLGAFVQHPDRALESHTLWPARRFSHSPNLSLSASPKLHLVHQFMDHVRTAPDTLAVETSRESWSYARLNNRVDQIAAHLQASCGESNARIALLLPPGISQIAATLAAFKMDAIVAWWPTASCEKTLTAALHAFPASIVVTDLSHAGRIRPFARSSTQIITLNEYLGSEVRDLPCPSEALHARLCLPTDASDASGAGASYTQCELSYHIGNYAKVLELKRADRLLCLCPCDPATVALSAFAALARGATWVHDTVECSIRTLQERLDRRGITILHTNPANYRGILSVRPRRPFLSQTRLIVLSGAPALQSDVQLHRRHLATTCRLMNAYQRRDFLWVGHFLHNPEKSPPHALLPIGRASGTHEFLLLDGSGNSADIAGEIAICHRPMAATPPSSPSADVLNGPPASTASTLLRTGHKGRRLPSGDILMTEDIAGVLPIRGRIIPLEEIESSLLLHPAVQQCVVDVVGANAATELLVAYLVTGESVSSLCLKRFLKRRLPTYLVPSHYLMRATLPRGEYGDVLRGVLRHETEVTQHISVASLQPQTSEEKAIAKIWADILGIADITRKDHFFDLGGNSLQVVKVIQAIQEQLHVDTSLRGLMTQNLCGLAADCARRRRQSMARAS